MTDRRRSFEQAPAHYSRILERIDTNAGRVEDLFDRLNGRLDRVDRDLAARELGEDGVRGELREFKREFADLRDAFNLADGRRTAAAAEGAAKGAAQVAATIAPEATKEAVNKSVWVKFTAGAAGLVAIMSVLNNIPDVARGWDKVWKAIKNEDHAASAPQRQDTTDGK